MRNAWKRIWLIVALVLIGWALSIQVFGQITIEPAEVEVGEMMIATVAPRGMPEGAVLKGELVVNMPEGTQWSPGPTPLTINIWGKPRAGTRKMSVFGLWGIPHATVEGAWADFGLFQDFAEVKITGGADPDPNPDPPDPPNPGGPYQIFAWYEADQLDNYPSKQRAILTSQVYRDRLVSLGHVVKEIIAVESFDPATAPDWYAPWHDAIKGDPLPRIAWAPREGGTVHDADLPADFAGVLKLLEGE